MFLSCYYFFPMADSGESIFNKLLCKQTSFVFKFCIDVTIVQWHVDTAMYTVLYNGHGI